MNFSNNDFKKTVKALSASYHAREPIDMDESWQARVTAHILKLGPFHTETAVTVFSSHFMWRFVPAACILITMLSFLLSKGTFDPDYEMTKFFFNDPIEYTVTQLWGM